MKRRVKTPTVIQMEAVECGAACLGIVLGYYKKRVPLEELRVACGVSRDGSKASNVVKAARSYGLIAKGYHKEVEGVKAMTFPVIVHWNFNHFVVVEGFHKGRVYLNDPATGPRVVSEEEFDEAFTGIVLAFEPGPEFIRETQTRSFWSALQDRLRGMRPALVFVLLISLLLVVPGMLLPVFAQVFVDEILLAGSRDWLLPLLAGLALTALLRGWLAWLQQIYLMRMETKLAVAMAGKYFWHILHLPMEFFAQRYSGDITERIRSNDKVAQLLSGQLATSILNAVMILFYTFLMFRYSVWLTLSGIVFALLNVGFLRYMSRRREDVNLLLLQDQSKLVGTSMSGLQMIETLKASGGESDFFTKWAGQQADVIRSEQKLGVDTEILIAAPTFLNMLNQVAVLALGAWQVLSGQMTVGMLVAFQSLMQSFMTPVIQLMAAGSQLQEAKGDLVRLDDVLEYPVDPSVIADSARPPRQAQAETAKLRGKVELRGVSYGYSRLEPPLIEDFNLVLEPGSRVALVGGSGSGKSTIAKLVSGLQQPWSGEILFDGKPRAEWPRQVLARSVAVVDQEISMFEGTIRDNLTLWNRTIPETDIVRAARDACIHDEIVSRPEGYDYVIEEGARNFSGGQKQRLEIARALVNNPAVLILDEATSALDPKTELLIDKHLRRRGCTCLIVAHRLSTIRDCDEILVLSEGKVVQRGTHEAMKAADGPYAELIRDA